jgi:hypothetical protein
MRHLDDGQIAELVDAIIPRRDGGAADRAHAEATDHLAVCTVCQERFEEARAIAARARAILAAAAPATTAIPPFDEVVHRAGRTRKAAGARGFRWLAWAATLVIAGGVGWFARGEWTTQTPVSLDPGFASGRVLERTAESARAAEGIASLPSPSGDRGANAPAASMNDEAGGAGASNPTRDLRRDGAVPPSPPAVQPTRPANEAAGRQDAAEERVAPAPLALTPPQVVGRAARERQDAARLERAEAEAAPNAKVSTLATGADADAAVFRVATREVAERALGGPAATVAGLRVRAYRVVDSLVPVVEVVQEIAPGVELVLRQTPARRAAAPPPSDRAAEPGAARRYAADAIGAVDSVLVSGLRVEARAPVSPDSLRALLRRLRR